MRVVALCNQKGGVGKTTTTYHLARAATQRGQRVLVIDLDPQGSLTLLTAAEAVAADSLSIADVLSPRTGEKLSEVTVPGIWDRLDLAPAVEAPLASVREELVGVRVGRESRLRQAIQDAETYDLVLIDCPPELGLLTINGLVAADTAVVVTESKLLAVQGTAGMMQTIDTIRDHYNPALHVAGVIVNRHEGQTVTGRERLTELRAAGLTLLEPIIPKRVPIGDAAEAAVGLDAWPGDGPALASLYTTLLDNTLERPQP